MMTQEDARATPDGALDLSAALLELLRARRSVRRYDGRPVPRELIERLLEAAIWAPSAHNQQPWRFVVVATPEARQRLATAMGTRFRADLTADGLPTEEIERRVQRSYERITGAPAVIVVGLSMEHMDRYPDARRQDCERLMAVQSVAAAIQNLLLAAHAHGLGACWTCAPLFCPDAVREALDLPPDFVAQALITLGWPDESPTTMREPLHTRVWYR
jgi:F420 biosynthesis protein FbiB-like protein